MTTHGCPRCGRPLPADAPAGLCGACLLAAGADTLTSGSVDSLPTVSSAFSDSSASNAGPALTPNGTFGAYTIGRLLGRGGMGEVYEAEHNPSGRRLALKVLRSRLQSANERARFLREGQLAASVSHPHTVYIFGSEEIDGMPVISMELLSGGTLKDRVVASGPMQPPDAVAAIMDVIGGLDAAAAAGILHRDIKPSNCFVDERGVVKVGDFGLSISTLARDVHQQLSAGGFEGTPQFAPPEQLRGEPLDVRADIYAVGATLYYLLTGQAPFDAPDLPELFARVTSDTPAPPRRLRPEVPARLSAVVMQCLAKQPADRPASYALLADDLRPFLARDDRPAPLGVRFVAAVLDSWIIVGIPAALASTLIADPLTQNPDSTAALTRWAWLVTFFYFLLIEGATGASLAKRLFRLRVISGDGRPASWRQIVIRTTVFYLPTIVMKAALLAGVGVDSRFDMVRSAFSMVLSAVLFFATARRSNGWTGLHDVLSGTRVIMRPPAAVRVTSQVRGGPVVPASATRRYGPFIAAGDGVAGTVIRGFDPVLRRAVWIRIVAPGTPPVDASRRDASRVGRLHWLTGRRSADDSWDAYEAPDGGPWIDAVSRETQWSQAQLQLLDLTDELSIAAADGTLPSLGLDRLWVRDDGHLVLLDFAPPDARSASPAELTPGQLLQAVAMRVPRAMFNPERLSLSARRLLEQWSSSPPQLPAARAELVRASTAHDRVHAWRRAVPISVAAAPVTLMLLLALLLIPALSRFSNADTTRMLNILGALQSKNPRPGTPITQPGVREAMEVYVAGAYRDLIRDDDFWNSGVIRGLASQYRPLAEDILKRHPNVSAADADKADALLQAARRGTQPAGARRQQSAVEMGGVIASTLTAAALAIVVVLSLLSSLLVPGGVIARQLGLAVVTRAGTEIGRLRSVARVLVAGLPALVWFVYLASAPRVQGFVPTPSAPFTATALTVGALAIGAVWTIVRRTRGPHDLLLGTWVVPR